MFPFCGPTAPFLVDGKCTDNGDKVTVDGGFEEFVNFNELVFLI